MKIVWYINKYIFKVFLLILVLSHPVLSSNKVKKVSSVNQGNSAIYEQMNGTLLSVAGDTAFVQGSKGKIPVLYGEKAPDELTGAVSFIDGRKIENVNGVNRMNSLTGLVPGLLVVQNDGFPGNESAGLYIRGQRTFGVSGNSPLVLLDGIETEITRISPYDIESITVLKDAISTVMYGLRGSNGVILITSRKGKEGNVRVNLNSQASVIRPTRLPEFLGSADYARLYNEAAMGEGLAPKYSQVAIDAYSDGSNPLLYPDNNLINNYLGDYSIQSRQNIDISGGTKNARYLISAGYVHNNGVFVTDGSVNTYNTNSALDLTDIHSNLDFKVNERLSVNVDIKAKFDRRNNPGSYSSDYDGSLLSSMMNTPPLAYPILNEDGSLGGTTDYKENIYGKLNKAGYSIWSRTFLLGNVNFDYNLGSLLEGLRLKGRVGYSSFFDHVTNRSKTFAVYEYLNDSTYNKIGTDTEMASNNNWSSNNRYYNGELGLQYEKSFGDNSVKGLLLIDRQEYNPRSIKLPRIYQGIKGDFSYNLKSKYFAAFAFAYQGSEQFPAGSRYGFFPAVGLGWIMSNEKFMEQIKGTLSYLKLRASAGRTGNDFDPYGTNTPYFAQYENYAEGSGYYFGTSPSSDQGFYEVNPVNSTITWEKFEKFNIGADAGMFNNKLSVTFNYFYEKNKDILVNGANPEIFGADFWYPVGIAKNQGIEGSVSWSHKVGDFGYFISANATAAKNSIIEQKEQPRAYEWMERTGNPIGSRFGYVFDRYFTEDDDFSQLPDQSQLGNVFPGDLKYKDLNGDNIIDDNDQMRIAKSSVPQFYYGVNAGFNFKGIDFSILFQGVAETEKVFSGSLIYEFVGGKGNVTKEHLGRWITGSGQNASYPRLSIQHFSNNRASSNYWVKDGSFLRLKTVELGYSLSKPVLEKLKLEKLRVYVNAYNLFTWNKFDFTDPETASDGTNYPIPSIVSVGFNIGF